MSANRGRGIHFICSDCSMGRVSKVIFTIFMCLLTGGWVLFLCPDCSMGCVSLVIVTILMCLLAGGQGMLFICSNCSMGLVSKAILTICMCLLTGGQGMLFIWSDFSMGRVSKATSTIVYYNCKECSLMFGNKTTLKKHFIVNHPKTVKCESCDETFNQFWKLKVHMKTHMSEKLFEC